MTKLDQLPLALFAPWTEEQKLIDFPLNPEGSYSLFNYSLAGRGEINRFSLES